MGADATSLVRASARERGTTHRPCYPRPVDGLPALTRRSPWMWIAGSILSCLLAVALGSRFRPSKWLAVSRLAGGTHSSLRCFPASYGLEDACPQRTTATGGQCDAGNQRAHGTMVLMADDHRSNGHTRGIDNFVCDETSAIGAGERLRIRHGRSPCSDTLDTGGASSIRCSRSYRQVHDRFGTHCKSFSARVGRAASAAASIRDRSSKWRGPPSALRSKRRSNYPAYGKSHT